MKSEKHDSGQDGKYPWQFGSDFRPPRRFVEPIPVEIPAEVKVYDFFEEAGVHITDGGISESIIVPAHTVDEARQVVKGALVAETGDGNSILVSFPPTSWGRASIAVDHQLAAEWVKGRRASNAAV